MGSARRRWCWPGRHRRRMFLHHAGNAACLGLLLRRLPAAGACSVPAMAGRIRRASRRLHGALRNPGYGRFLAVPAAIAYMEANDWQQVRKRCHRMARDAKRAVEGELQTASLCPESFAWFSQLCPIRLPDDTDIGALNEMLRDRYRIEMPLLTWQGIKLARLSVQVYTQQREVDAAVAALLRHVPECRPGRARGHTGQTNPGERAQSSPKATAGRTVSRPNRRRSTRPVRDPPPRHSSSSRAVSGTARRIPPVARTAPGLRTSGGVTSWCASRRAGAGAGSPRTRTPASRQARPR